MSQNVYQTTHTAYAKAGFYAALNGYIEVFSPTHVDMLGNSYAGRSAASWLDIATDHAHQMNGEEKQALDVITTVKTLVDHKQYSEAQQIVMHGAQNADAEIRRVR